MTDNWIISQRWRDVPGYPGYQVSDYGRVRNRSTGRMLLGSIDRYGYRYVNLTAGGMVHRRVHRLVCEAWNGPPPSSTHHAAHLDGNPLNNRAENLVWATPKENSAHKILQGRPNGGGNRCMAGRNNPNGQLSEETVEEIRQSPLSTRQAAKAFGISQSHAARIKNGTRRSRPSHVSLSRPDGLRSVSQGERK